VVPAGHECPAVLKAEPAPVRCFASTLPIAAMNGDVIAALIDRVPN
jgi:hypothetical protein